MKNSSIAASSNLEATLLEQSIKLNAGSTSVETTELAREIEVN